MVAVGHRIKHLLFINGSELLGIRPGGSCLPGQSQSIDRSYYTSFAF
jgi:hypothetical protein